MGRSRKLIVEQNIGFIFFFCMHSGVLDGWDGRGSPAPCPWHQDQWVDMIPVLAPGWCPSGCSFPGHLKSQERFLG